MIKVVFFMLLLTIGSLVSFQASHAFIPQAVAKDANMEQVQLLLKKLRASMESLKDFDELEAAGMDKEDVDRLRNAMKQKIKQMTSDAVDLIRVL